MTSDSSNTPEKKKAFGFTKYIPLILAIIIVIVVAIVVIRINIWNKGVPYEVNPDLILETETEDVYYLNMLSTVWQDQDDKERNIVLMGNNTAGNADSSKTMAEIIADKTDATVYDCTFPSSTITSSQSSWDEEYENPMDTFCFYWLSDSICNQDFTRQYKALELFEDKQLATQYKDKLAQLETVDFEKIDLVIFSYDSYDYIIGRGTYDITQPYDITTICGSYAGSYSKYTGNFSNIQLMMVAPTYCELEQNNAYVPCDLADAGYGTLTNCLTHLRDFCIEYEVTYLDNYYGIAITEDNASQYLEDNHYIPNEVGRNMIAVRIADKINLYLDEIN